MGLVLAAVWICPGCGREADELVIACPWSEAERDAVASEFRSWAAANPGAAVGPIRVRWIPLMPGDDPSHVVRRRRAPDLLLGCERRDFERLARENRLVPIERTSHPAWCVVRRESIGMLGNERAMPRLPPGSRPETFASDDYRHDRVALAWARWVLARTTWAEGYAWLVRCAGDPRPFGRQPGASLAAVERGESAMTLMPPDRSPARSPRPDSMFFVADDLGPWWVEGVAVIRGGDNPSLAQEFVRFLADRRQAESPPGPDTDPRADPAAEALLADLLGATLVDAQAELRAAWARLEVAGRPRRRRAEHWMTEAPPWPPASITRLLARGEDGATLLDTLIGEVAPAADLRAWLSRSWLGPTRPIDGAFLSDLARAVDGRLAREPRFRAWLRGEWTAWARQRYRRVARLAEAAVP